MAEHFVGQAVLLVPTVIYASMRDHGDGSVGIYWCLTKEHAQADQNNPDRNGWGEECIEAVQTYEGSRIWLWAVENTQEYEQEKLRKS